MTAGGPRNARYVDPTSREAAEDLARRSGLSLGEWVSRLMAEGPEDATSQDYFSQPMQPNYVETPRPAPSRYETLVHPVDEIGRVTGAIDRLSERIESAESRQALAIAGIERSVREVIGRIDSAEREQMQVAARFEGAVQDAKGETAQIFERMRRIEAEAAEPRAVREVIDRIDSAEREQVQVAARFEGAVQEAKGEAARLSERMRRIEEEAAGPRSAEALKALEGALGKVAGHVYEGEKRSREMLGDLNGRVQRLDAAEQAAVGAIRGMGDLRGRVERLDAAEQATVGAIRDLQSTCSALDDRLSLAERGAEESMARAAANLSARVEATRDDLAAQLAAAADARFDRMEQTLSRMSEHVQAAEQRQAGALERMGREVLEVAQALNRKVQAVDRGGAQAIDRVSSEVARITGAVEVRLSRADAIQAQALEKLGGEIARITERLADRIGNAERRSAQAIDDVGEQVARITERVSQRQERTTAELADRIRQSEERTARLLEEARLKIDDRLSETQRRIAEAPRAPAASLDEVDETLFGDAPFPGFETPPAERPFARADEPEFPAARPAAPAAAAFDEDDFDALARFDAPPAAPPVVARAVAAPAPAAPALHEAELDDVELEPNVGFDVDDELIGPATSVYQPAPPPRPRPATAPAAESAPTASAPPPVEPPRADPAGQPASALTTREVIERARAAARAAGDRDGRPRPAAPRPADDTVVQSLTFGRSRKKPGGGMTGALMVASLMAAIGLSASGYVFLEMKPGGKPPRRVADSLSVASDAGAQPPADATPLAAIALAPQPDAGPDLTGAYSAAIAKINADQTDGLADLRKLADGGYAPAQFFLAELYQDGKAGLHKDPVESRRWLEKAAEGGDRTAMHNLALDLHEGIGGGKDAAAAAEWFRRAAELGLLDSQFNLAALYEHGDGVSLNMAEAYKWYLIAGRAGDADSRAGALRVRAGLSADERAMAERAAQDFQPSAPNPSTVAGAAPAAPAAPQPDIVTAQRALNQLGYYQGPTDGAASPALHLALAAYQRDQSLPVTGDADAATIGKLQVYTR